MFYLIWAWANSWANNGDAGDAHCDVIVMNTTEQRINDKIINAVIIFANIIVHFNAYFHGIRVSLVIVC